MEVAGNGAIATNNVVRTRHNMQNRRKLHRIVSYHGVLAMTVQEKLESLAFSETERALIRKWLNETPSRSKYALPGTASASLLYPERYSVGVTAGDGVGTT